MLFSKGMRLLVADEARALLLENTGSVEAPQLRVLGERKAAPSAQFSDRPGREQAGAGGHGTAFEQGDPERVAQQRFAREIASWFGAHSDGARLVVAAPPRMLAALREAMPEPLARRVVAEIDKTLTGLPLPEVAKVLAMALDPV